MSLSNMTSHTQTVPAQQSYPQHVVYLPTGQAHQQQHQPRLMYFITRTNGSIVPLVPTDELPFSVRLEGAPRNMSPEQTFGMQFLGSLPYTGMFFKTKDEATSMQRATSQPNTPLHHRQYSDEKQYMAPDALARQTATNAAHHSYNLSNSYPTAMIAVEQRQENTTHPHRDAAHGPTKPLTDPQAIIDAIVSSKSGAETAARVGYVPKSAVSTPSGKIPDANKKTHCSYWIRTGECDYAQQGCMYKHEMPDEKGLLELGFRTTPRWWVEKEQVIKLGNASGGQRLTVGPAVKPSEWLRKESVASTESAKSSGSDTESESGKSKDSGKSVKHSPKVSQKQSIADSKDAQGALKKITILQKPAQKSFSSSSAEKGQAAQTPIEADKPIATGNLIDLEPSDPSPTSLLPTPSTSTDDSPRVSPTTLKAASPTIADIPKRREIFVPKGESRMQHLADHISRQQRSAVRRPKPSEAQIASLEKQIQRAQKSKSLASASAGMMASRHAPDGHKGWEGKKEGRRVDGLRVRRPALQCVEISTGKKLKERDDAAVQVKPKGRSADDGKSASPKGAE